ncbi:hypothetical protein B0H13DRAFT_1857406 [Mycena leptocephala]|nr:hypothetical protein B0H13DRAFT_1857406 [Mycena leptocephala]
MLSGGALARKITPPITSSTLLVCAGKCRSSHRFLALKFAPPASFQLPSEKCGDSTISLPSYCGSQSLNFVDGNASCWSYWRSQRLGTAAFVALITLSVPLSATIITIVSNLNQRARTITTPGLLIP